MICSFDSLVCNNKDPFTTSLWYLEGIEMMNELLYSSRLNEYTTTGRNKAKELRNMYEVKYRGGEIDEISHEGELAMAIDGINLNMTDYCLQCNEPVRYENAVI